MVKNIAFKHSLERGVLYSFIPQPLEIAEKPELNVFPFNVMFAQYKVEEGETIRGTVIYEPDLGSFRQEGEKCSMKYHNIYGSKNWLVIEYDILKKSYLGKKIADEKIMGMAIGMDWKMFFVHFTGLGLYNGEQCKFENENREAV